MLAVSLFVPSPRSLHETHESRTACPTPGFSPFSRNTGIYIYIYRADGALGGKTLMSVEKKTCAAGSFPRKIDLIYARGSG